MNSTLVIDEDGSFVMIDKIMYIHSSNSFADMKSRIKFINGHHVYSPFTTKQLLDAIAKAGNKNNPVV